MSEEGAMSLVWPGALGLVLLLPAGAAAGQGWYYIVPPLSQAPTATETGRFNANAAPSQWAQMGAFDTAQECERARRAKETEHLEILKTLHQEDKENISVKMRTLISASILSGRCIASDDPRLRQ